MHQLNWQSFWRFGESVSITCKKYSFKFLYSVWIFISIVLVTSFRKSRYTNTHTHPSKITILLSSMKKYSEEISWPSRPRGLINVWFHFFACVCKTMLHYLDIKSKLNGGMSEFLKPRGPKIGWPIGKCLLCISGIQCLFCTSESCTIPSVIRTVYSIPHFLKSRQLKFEKHMWRSREKWKQLVILAYPACLVQWLAVEVSVFLWRCGGGVFLCRHPPTTGLASFPLLSLTI